MSAQVCSNVFDLSTDWNASGAEQLYTVNPANGQITTESRRRALLSSNDLQFSSRTLLGGATGAAAAANEPVSSLTTTALRCAHVRDCFRLSGLHFVQVFSGFLKVAVRGQLCMCWRVGQKIPMQYSLVL